MAFLPVAEQLAVIRRGVEKIVPEQELEQRLESSRASGVPLRVKYGIDPTGIDVHLGHTVPLRKLRQFQDLGHQAVIIIGNATALVGDPSGRDQARSRKLTPEDVERNARDYLAQVGRVVDLDRAEVHRNANWFGPMAFTDLLSLCGKVTVAQLLTRDDFSKRMAAGTPIFLHECLYPVMQAWDSVMIRSDIELGGTEQLYSFMLARDLQRTQGLPEQIGVMSPILVGLDGVRRMGKSLGNYIGVAEPAYDMMKKFMQLPDDCMRMYFELLTTAPLDDVGRLLGGHPKQAKLTLAKTVIDEYHGAGAGDEAAARWQREIGEGALPEDIPIATIPASAVQDGHISAAQLLKLAGLCASTSDARRAIQQGGAYIGDDKRAIASHDEAIPVSSGMLIRVGKKRICRLEIGGG
ncbi:MAG: tyrosine--tRNA ligase [Planctomyces sp.]|nr:tyrosine--tRNA ligase [Planctomyces sp.]